MSCISQGWGYGYCFHSNGVRGVLSRSIGQSASQSPESASTGVASKVECSL